ncbi:hypothetical protein C900_04784 [Fulvivirga imtechensis AK7]|uniref:DUF4143 domain-containing protein n=1 Tax=Fulvivirga imtechensis AK7 TaxID=1237149 RepID=L8JPX6_9BACT|nr:hypothetical protein C900_04784 [Fulvivirga imtechensis AK7]
MDDLRLNDRSQANGRYLLTGSANILAIPQLSNALVGRMSVMTLYPFCTAEASKGKGGIIHRIINMDFSGMNDRGITTLEAIKLGTFPEISGKTTDDQRIWFDGYLTTILQRDVRMLADLEKIALLPSILRILATRTGNLINDSDISRDVGLHSVTGKFYRNILKMMFLNFDIIPWYRNIGKRLVKSPKGYLTDTLMLCHLLGLNIDTLIINKPDLFGHILENYVATELVKQLSFSNIKAQLFHFRTSDGKEVDFILERPDGGIFAIEVKAKESVSIQDFKGIQVLASLIKNDFKGGIVLYPGRESIPFVQNLWAVPLYSLWQ